MEEKKTPTIEDYKNYCNQLLMQRNEAIERLNEVSSTLNKLPWLFKVVEFSHMFDTDFVGQCIEEIRFIMTPPKEEEQEEKKENNEEVE